MVKTNELRALPLASQSSGNREWVTSALQGKCALRHVIFSAMKCERRKLPFGFHKKFRSSTSLWTKFLFAFNKFSNFRWLETMCNVYTCRFLKITHTFLASCSSFLESVWFVIFRFNGELLFVRRKINQCVLYNGCFACILTSNTHEPVTRIPCKNEK